MWGPWSPPAIHSPSPRGHTAQEQGLCEYIPRPVSWGQPLPGAFGGPSKGGRGQIPVRRLLEVGSEGTEQLILARRALSTNM